MNCPKCDGEVTHFRHDIFFETYEETGLCQECQDVALIVGLEAELAAARQRIEKLIAAALPVIERWDHGSGMDGVLIDALREALKEQDGDE